MRSADGTTKNNVLCPLPTDRACAEVRLWNASGVVNPLSSPVWRIGRRGNTVAYKLNFANGSLQAKQNINAGRRRNVYHSASGYVLMLTAGG